MTDRGPGWYDVGGGWAGRWDGQQWTGERISHQQLAAMIKPPAPPPPMVPPAPAAGQVGAPPQRGWLIAGAIGGVILLGMIIGGAVADDSTSSSRSTRTTATAIPRAKAEELALIAVLGQVNPDIATAYRDDPTGTIATAKETADAICDMSTEADRQGVDWGTAIALMYTRMDGDGQDYFGGPEGLAKAAGAMMEWRCPEVADRAFD